MKKLFFIMVVMVLVGCISTGFSYAKEKKPTKKASQKMKQTTYDTMPFDLSVTKLPPGYKGHAIEKLYHKLEHEFPQKTEFETQEVYTKRMKSFETNQLYAFTIEKSAQSCLESHYNAEKQTLGVSFMMGKYFGNESLYDNVITTVETKSINERGGKYIGSNAYGARAVVEKRKRLEYGIAFSNVQLVNDKNLKLNDIPAFSLMKQGNPPSYGIQEGDNYVIRGSNIYEIRGYKTDITISPDDAKSLKENLGILLICTPKVSKNSKLFYKIEKYKRATFDSPDEITILEHVIFTKVLEIWVYNNKTGQIFAKQKIII